MTTVGYDFAPDLYTCIW